MTEKRPWGSGTVSQYRLKYGEYWRIRLPGSSRKEYSGFKTREEAERALEHAISGVEMPRPRRPRLTIRDLNSLLRRAREVAAKLGIELEISHGQT